MRAALVAGLLCSALVVLATPVRAQYPDRIASVISGYQFDLSGDGQAFLATEASHSAFVLVGGLHGDNETPALFQRLVDAVGAGTKLVVTELSPWAASRFASAAPDSSGIQLRGIDVEGGEQLPRIVRDVAAANPQNARLQEMLRLVSGGYRRALAPELLELAARAGELQSERVGGVALAMLLVR